MRRGGAAPTPATRVYDHAGVQRRRLDREVAAVERRARERDALAAAVASAARDAAEDADAAELDDSDAPPAYGDLGELEEAMRAQLRGRHRVAASWKDVLMRACERASGARAAPGAGPAARAAARAAARGELAVSAAQFRAAWRSLGVRMSASDALSVCARLGFAPGMRVRVEAFARALMRGAARNATSTHGVQRGAFNAETYLLSSERMDARPAFEGKITYPPCKTGVFAPVGFTRAGVRESARAPRTAGLALDFVAGYGGLHNTAPNLFYTAAGECVYYAGALGIVFDPRTRTQRYFGRAQGRRHGERKGGLSSALLGAPGERHEAQVGHDDDILCLNIHPDRTRVASGQAAAAPCAIVWDTGDCSQLARLQHGEGMRGVLAVAFCARGGGRWLVTVCSDNRHTICVWDWARGVRLASAPSRNGVPPQVYGITWNPNTDEFLSYGVKHLTLWEIDASSGALLCEKASFGRASPHDVLCAAFLESGTVLSGCETGEIASWRGGVLRSVSPAHAPGKRGGGCRVLRVRSGGRTMLSGGADGRVLVWDVSSGALGSVLRSVTLDAPPGERVPALRSLDCMPGSDVFVAGTSSCDIWEVDQDPEVLIYGHSADLYGVAFHPDRSLAHVFATACDSSRVFIWDARNRRRLAAVECASNARSAAFATTANGGGELAVGLVDGSVEVFDVREVLSLVAVKTKKRASDEASDKEQREEEEGDDHGDVAAVGAGRLRPPDRVCCVRKAKSAVDVLAYSPDGLTLAAGTHDCHVELFACAGGLLGHLATCKGHSATISALDWSADGTLIQCTSNAYELLYFNGQTGAPVTAAAGLSGRRWASWTCPLGFPVMGIWPDGADGTDVNSVCATSDRKLLAAADDFGAVRLMNYPCVVDEAPSRIYYGHSSHVMGTRFSCDDKWLVSTGGHDRAVFIWSLDPGMHASEVEHEVSPEEALQYHPPVAPPRTQAPEAEPITTVTIGKRPDRRLAEPSEPEQYGIAPALRAHEEPRDVHSRTHVRAVDATVRESALESDDAEDAARATVAGAYDALRSELDATLAEGARIEAVAATADAYSALRRTLDDAEARGAEIEDIASSVGTSLASTPAQSPAWPR